MDVRAKALTADAFAPFGDVVEAPAKPGRAYFASSLGNLRTAAAPKLWMLTKQPSPFLPLRIDKLERHAFSSQSFVPIDIGRWLVVVAPSDTRGEPDVARAKAFLPSAGQAVSYRPNVWHCGLHVFDQTARLAVFMWLDGTRTDEEIVPVSPFTVHPDTPYD
jgi:ureidoglycolate lyase